MKLFAFLAVAILLQRSELDRVVARLDEYLAGYEPKLSELVADESMQQEADLESKRPSFDIHGNPARPQVRRRLVSEVAFIALPDDRGWLGFRHVKTVDARPVVAAERSLSAALQTRELDAARELLKASAAHNLGLERTTNLPNLPLEFLHRRNRDRLVPRVDGRDNVRGIQATRLVFEERGTPTLISNPANGTDMPSVITAWVDPANGRLLRAEVKTHRYRWMKQPTQVLTVEFSDDKTLNLLVPSEMREVFPVEYVFGKGVSVARYSNFRRFQTAARIVPQ